MVILIEMLLIFIFGAVLQFFFCSCGRRWALYFLFSMVTFNALFMLTFLSVTLLAAFFMAMFIAMAVTGLTLNFTRLDLLWNTYISSGFDSFLRFKIYLTLLFMSIFFGRNRCVPGKCNLSSLMSEYRIFIIRLH